MKDNAEVMSVEVSAAPTAETLKAAAIQQLDLHATSNGENGVNGSIDEDLVVELEKEDDSEASKTVESESVTEILSETEDEILNKIDTNDVMASDTPEEKLLDESDSEIDTVKINGYHDTSETNTTSTDDIPETPQPVNGFLENGDSDDKTETIEENSDSNDKAETIEVNSDSNDKAETLDVPLEPTTTPEETTDELQPTPTKEDAPNDTEKHEEDDIQTKEQQDAELLKDQIMDTEDLLQIVEDNKQQTEVDQEQERDEDSDSCKLVDTETNDENEVESNTTEDDQNAKDDETKDEMEIEEELISENTAETALVVDEKCNDSESEGKDTEMVDEIEAVSETEAVSVVKDIDSETLDKTPDETPPPPMKTAKRTLSESETETEPKKPKLVSGDETEPVETAQIKKDNKLERLCDFMQGKGIVKLSRGDLDDYCLKKICEGIYHNSDIGELRHQLGMQEQMIEMWRKEVMQLTKQLRDLEIVNKRLLHEVRQKNDRPLAPVKITRSVGLQVRCDSINPTVMPKRKVPAARVPPPLTPPISKPAVVKMTPPAIKPATSVQPNSIKSPKIINSKANTLLTQALASTTLSKSPLKTVTSTPLRVVPVKQQTTGKNVMPKVTAIITPTHSSKAVDKTFIDLTDEEEKRPTVTLTGSGTPTTNMRFVKTPTTVVTTTAANGPRIMYVYNNQLHQGLIATDPAKPGSQKLMLKLNSNMMTPTNSVLAVPNGPIRHPVRFSSPVTGVRNSVPKTIAPLRHPAPLPLPPSSQLSIAARKAIPPKPHLNIRRSSGGIVLSWKMPYNLDNYESIASYQLYAYQETSALPSSDMWRRVGDVKALALPMACTLTQFADGNKYHFAVRAVDVHKRMGAFSDPEQILL